jgi:pimeloyl-ACP methyl ester carboxylesterase
MARLIAPEVARTTTVVVYDRAGHGRSDAEPAAGADAARDLHVLLERAHVPGPYVLAGHSLGGMFALSYAHRYPAEVGGIVLLDSMHPRQHNAFAGMDPLLALVPTLARTGLASLLFDRKDGNPTAQARQLARDITDMPAELNRAAALTSLGNKPLIVLSAGTGSLPGWTAQQNDLAGLSTRSVHRTIAGATHASLIDDRVDAARSAMSSTLCRRPAGDGLPGPSAHRRLAEQVSHDAAAAAFPSPARTAPGCWRGRNRPASACRISSISRVARPRAGLLLLPRCDSDGLELPPMASWQTATSWLCTGPAPRDSDRSALR